MINDSAPTQIDQHLSNQNAVNEVSSTGWLGNRLRI